MKKLRLRKKKKRKKKRRKKREKKEKKVTLRLDSFNVYVYLVAK